MASLTCKASHVIIHCEIFTLVQVVNIIFLTDSLFEREFNFLHNFIPVEVQLLQSCLLKWNNGWAEINGCRPDSNNAVNHRDP